MSTPNISQSLVVALLAGILPVSAQEKKESNAKTAAYQTSVSQEQLRSNTRRLKLEMISLLDEYSQYQAGWHVQDDYMLSKKLTLSFFDSM